MSSYSPAYLMERLHAFLQLNPGFWPAFKAKAAAQAKATGYVCGRQVLDELRRERFIKPDGEQYRLRNEYEPILARLFRLACPEYADAITLKKSRFDSLVTAELLADWGLG